MQISQSVVINCAGIGSRLGFGHTKALLNVAGKPMIIHHLEALKKIEDVRVVVGFGAQDVIETVTAFRKEVIFVFNHAYKTTNTLTSLYLGAQHANEYVLTLDGDLLVDPKDLRIFLQADNDCLGYCDTYSDHPVCVEIEKKGERFFATGFTRKKGFYEWTGLAKIKRDHILNLDGHVYESIEKFLPIEALEVNCREIDTPQDLERALLWAKQTY